MGKTALRQDGADRLFDWFIGLILFACVVVTLFPLLYVTAASFSSPATVLRGEVWVWPKGFHLRSYERVFSNRLFLRSYGNTLLYTGLGVVINLVLTTLGAFVLSRKRFYGKGLLTVLFTFTMFFNGGLIPRYLVVKGLGMVNTLWAVIIPTAVSMWNLVIMRNYFHTAVPYELQEAAQIDGCSNFQTLCRVVLPVSGPILAVMLIYYGVGHWNAYFDALIYLSDQNKYPLQLILRQILLENDMSNIEVGMEVSTEHMLIAEGIKFAVVVVASLPIMTIYPFLQRFFVKGVMIGAIKG